MAEITLKLCGVLWIGSAATSFAALVAAQSWHDEFSSPVAYVTLLSALILGVALIALSGRISNLLFPVVSDLSSSIHAKDLLAVGLVLVGVYFIVTGLRHASAVLYQFAAKPKWDEVPIPEYLWDRAKQEIVGSAVELIAGIVLAVGNAPLARMWSRHVEETET